MAGEEEHPSTRLFRDYIRINTMQPNPDYPACTKFLQGVADSLGLTCKVNSTLWKHKCNQESFDTDLTDCFKTLFEKKKSFSL